MPCMLCACCTRLHARDWAQAFLPLLGMDASLEGPPGRVLNMSSIYGSYALPFSVRACTDRVCAAWADSGWARACGGAQRG